MLELDFFIWQKIFGYVKRELKFVCIKFLNIRIEDKSYSI